MLKQLHMLLAIAVMALALGSCRSVAPGNRQSGYSERQTGGEARSASWSKIPVRELDYSQSCSDVDLPWMSGADGLLVGPRRFVIDVSQREGRPLEISIGSSSGFRAYVVKFRIPTQDLAAPLPAAEVMVTAHWDVVENGIRSEQLEIIDGFVQLDYRSPSRMYFYVLVRCRRPASGCIDGPTPLVGVLDLSQLNRAP
jgi:hypothetical protein